MGRTQIIQWILEDFGVKILKVPSPTIIELIPKTHDKIYSKTKDGYLKHEYNRMQHK